MCTSRDRDRNGIPFNRRNEVAQRRIRDRIHETDEVVGKIRVERSRCRHATARRNLW